MLLSSLKIECEHGACSSLEMLLSFRHQINIEASTADAGVKANRSSTSRQSIDSLFSFTSTRSVSPSRSRSKSPKHDSSSDSTTRHKAIFRVPNESVLIIYYCKSITVNKCYNNSFLYQNSQFIFTPILIV